MTPKEITTLAGHRLVPPWVMKLALDVAAAEREACAKVCERLISGDGICADDGVWIHDCAAAIRNRGDE